MKNWNMLRQMSVFFCLAVLTVGWVGCGSAESVKDAADSAAETMTEAADDAAEAVSDAVDSTVEAVESAAEGDN